MSKVEDMTGKRFGKLYVESFAGFWVSSSGKTRNNQWRCICDCGNVSIVRSSKLKDGSTKSCGCYRVSRAKLPRTSKGKSGLRNLYNSYRSQAKHRGLKFEIEFIEFEYLTSLNCTYCGRVPSQKYTPASRTELATEHGIYIYNGIDRIDSNLGYLKGNVITCCKRCNIAKSNMSKNDFIYMIKDIYENFVVKQYNK